MKFEKVTLENQTLQYTSLFQKVQVPLDQIVWAYLRKEDSRMTMCCGKFVMTSCYFAYYVAGSKKRHLIPFDQEQPVRDLLDALAQQNPAIDIGYSEEKKQRYS